ncbi:MAG: AAA family ATPase [Pseudoclavibacter sp.]|nr:AAA family ATPase [Pseudoclavibacter sp.]
MWGLFRKRRPTPEELGGSSGDAAFEPSEALRDRTRLGRDEETRDLSALRGAARERAAEPEAPADVSEDPVSGPAGWVAEAVANRAGVRPDAAGEDAERTVRERAAEARAEREARQAAKAAAAAEAAAPRREAEERERRAEQERAAAMEAVRGGWLDELAVLGGPAPLLFFSDESGTYIELTSAHPGGIAPLLAERAVLLSNLVRDPGAFRQARAAAALIAQKGVELVASRGMSTVALATGIAEWTHDGVHHRAPVLTRPVRLRRSGRDYEVELLGQTHANASLLRALAEQFGVRITARELLDLARENEGFLPQAVFEHVRHRAARIPGFTVAARAVVSSFGDAATAMVRDADGRLDHPVLRALAGDESAVAAIRGGEGGPGPAADEEEPVSPDRRDPAADRLLLDADTEQERVVDAITRGRSITVDALPGTGLTQTVVNAIGSLVADGRRVLVVSPRSASLRAIRLRLRSLGLGGLALTPRTVLRDTIAAIGRNERAERPEHSGLADALVRLRHVLADYRTAMTRPDEALGASPLDALEALSGLELLDVPPATTARLEHAALVRLADDRNRVAEMLRELGELGQFRYGPDDSPWYGVSFISMDEAREARQTAAELADGRMREAIDGARAIIERTRLRPAENWAELGIYLLLLLDIRETLDRFVPAVFDRSLAELIQATSPARDVDMPSARRRQLRQVARDYVRPGQEVPDLHESLRRIQRQRVLWRRYVTDDSIPVVPPGVVEARERHRRVTDRLHIVDDPLVEAGADSLVDIPLDELPARLEALAADSEVLDNLMERLRLGEQLQGMGLEPLLNDLAERHVPVEEVGDELELAWWQSALEHMLANDKALLAANTHTLTRLEHDFRTVDQAHPRSTAQQLAWQLAEAWRVALVDHADQAEPLRALLRRQGVTSARLVREAGRIAAPLTQLWLATPYDVPLITDEIAFDTVLIVDAASLSVPEAIGAVRRGRQLVAFGDPVTESPERFSIAVQSHDDAAAERDGLSEEEAARRAGASLHARLGELVPRYRLTHSYRAGGEDLAELVNRRFYDGGLQSMPWAGTFLGHPSLSYSFVEDGTGMPDPVSGAVESTDAEVTRVVELAIDHALRRSRESLMVLTASPVHARRVEQAVYSAVSRRADVAPFFTSDRGEPFLVSTIEQASAQSRDRVVFSLGYGRTPHGRVLNDLGVLGSAAGERAVAVSMTRARRSLTIVSCVRPGELDPQRFTRGTLAFAQILGDAESNALARHEPQPGEELFSPMLHDLAQRLERLGMTAQLAYRGRIPLAASYGGRAIAIDMDGLDERFARSPEPTLRETLRLRPELLKRLGWYYLRVHAFELFAHPETVARRIASALFVPLPAEHERIERAPRRIAAAGTDDPGGQPPGAAEQAQPLADRDEAAEEGRPDDHVVFRRPDAPGGGA